MMMTGWMEVQDRTSVFALLGPTSRPAAGHPHPLENMYYRKLLYEMYTYPLPNNVITGEVLSI